MARAGQVRFVLTRREAGELSGWIANQSVMLPGLLVTDREAYYTEESERLQRLGKVFGKAARRARSGDEFRVLIDRADLQWIGRRIAPRGLFGARRTPSTAPLSIGLRLRLADQINPRRGRKRLTRDEVKSGGYGIDPRHRMRLERRCERAAAFDTWHQRRLQAGLPTGLLAMYDPSDPAPKLP